jgi:hypothetical protein
VKNLFGGCHQLVEAIEVKAKLFLVSKNRLGFQDLVGLSKFDEVL